VRGEFGACCYLANSSPSRRYRSEAQRASRLGVNSPGENWRATDQTGGCAHRSSVEEQVFLAAAADFGVESPVPVAVLETNTPAIGSRQAGGGSRGQPIDWRCACTHVSSDSLK
jgi:hypothetical protein